MIRRGNHDRIDILVIQHAAEIVLMDEIVPLLTAKYRCHLVIDGAIDIAEGLKVRTGLNRSTSHALALISSSDQRQVHAVIRA